MALKKIFDAFQNATDAQRTFREISFLQQMVRVRVWVRVSITNLNPNPNPNPNPNQDGHENIVQLYNVLKVALAHGRASLVGQGTLTLTLTVSRTLT